MFTRRYAHRTTAIAVSLVFVLAACATSADTGGAPDAAPSLEIASPEEGAEVGQEFEIAVDSSVPIGAPETGNHHVHLYFDTDITSGDYQLVYEDTVAVERQLEPGEHTIVASLRNADHSDAGPTDEITITVTDDPAADGTDDDSGATDGDDAAPAPAPTDDGGLFDY